MMDCPMPNDTVDNAIVIASGYHTDTEYGVLLMDSKAPFYRIAFIDAVHNSVVDIATHENIIPAARQFEETFNFWGED